MRRSPKLALFAAAALTVPLLSTPASAFQFSGTAGVTCKAVTFSDDASITYDRDNTGIGSEHVRLDVYDGAGHLIFSGEETKALGTPQTFDAFYPYASTPTFNPLTAYLTSLAGNGVAEQRVVIASGSCEDLPEVPPPLTLDPSATTEPPATAPPTTGTIPPPPTEAPTIAPTPPTAAPAKPGRQVRPATGARPRRGASRYTG